MSQLNERSVVRKSGSQVSTVLDGEALALSVEKSRYFKMTGTGFLIWEGLGKPLRVSEIVDRLVSEFEVDREECLADTIRFLKSSHEAGLVEIS